MELSVCKAHPQRGKWVIRVRLGDVESRLRWKHKEQEPDCQLLFGSRQEAEYCKRMIEERQWILNDNRVAVVSDWLAHVTGLYVEQIDKLDVLAQHNLLLQTIRIQAERCEQIDSEPARELERLRKLDGTDTVILETLSEFGKEIVAQAMGGNPLPDLTNPAWETARAAFKSMCVERVEPFTPEVQKAWEALIHAHQAFVEIPKNQLHPHSLDEWVTAIHAAQAVLEHMVLRKLYPHIFK